MKISMIVPVYRGADKLLKLLKHLSHQNIDDFEVILVIDTNKERILSVVDEYKKNMKNLKIVFNTKRVGRSLALKQGIKMATGEYLVLANTSVILNKTSMEKLNSMADKFNGTDIIEFKSSFKFPIKVKGKIRKRFAKPVKIEDKPEVIAYTNPFSVFRLIRRVALEPTLTTHSLAPLNSIFSINSTYISLINAETYVNVPTSPFTINSKLRNNFNPPKMIRQWKRMLAFIDEQYPKYNQEIQYAYYYALSIYISSFTHTSKNKITIKKVREEHARFINETNFFKTNKYILANLIEAKVLREHKTFSKTYGLYKKV